MPANFVATGEEAGGGGVFCAKKKNLNQEAGVLRPLFLIRKGLTLNIG